MKRYFVAACFFLVSACASQQPLITSVESNPSHRAEVGATDPLSASIANALSKDKSVFRAYLALNNSDADQPVFVLAPIFDGEYPKDALGAAYSAFYKAVPNGKLELWLVPKREYKYLSGTTDLCARLTMRSSRNRFVPPNTWQIKLAMCLAPLRSSA